MLIQRRLHVNIQLEEIGCLPWLLFAIHISQITERLTGHPHMLNTQVLGIVLIYLQ